MIAFVENVQNQETHRDRAQGSGRSVWKGGRGGTPARQVRRVLLGEDTVVTLDRGRDGRDPTTRQAPPSCSL